MQAIQAGLEPAPIPTIPENTPPQFMAPISGAYQAGAVAAMTGEPQNFIIPQITDVYFPTGALWVYYNQGSSYTMQQKFAATVAPQPSRSQAPKIRQPDIFDGSRTKYKSYITQLHLIFNSNPTRYQTEWLMQPPIYPDLLKILGPLILMHLLTLFQTFKQPLMTQMPELLLRGN